MRNFVKLFSILIVIYIPTIHAATDLKCMENCISMGYPQDVCVTQCSYENMPAKDKKLDSKCLDNCTRKGHTSLYCQQYCTY